MIRILLILLLLCSPVYGAEVIASFEEENISVLNEELRSSSKRLITLENANTNVGIGTVEGVLPLVNGGTGTAFADPGGDRIMFWDDSASTTEWLGIGTALATNNLTLVNTAPGLSNTIWLWNGQDDTSSNDGGLYLGASATGTGTPGYYFHVWQSHTNVYTFFRFKFTKISGISTVTIHARMKVNAGTGTMTVDIGGANNTVTQTGTSFAWVTTSDIDVSGLTDGTTYEGQIKLNTADNSHNVFCSAITLIGS